MKSFAAALRDKPIIKDQSLLRHGDIKGKIRILPELQALIPRLDAEELRQLEENIRRQGCREALLVWETTETVLEAGGTDETAYVLVDGHNRHAICTKNGIDFKISLVSFPSLTEVRHFMIDNQLGRRNLTPEKMSYLRGLRYQSEKGTRGKYERQNHKAQNEPYAENPASEPAEKHKVQNEPYGVESGGSTAQKLSRHFKVSEATIKRDAEFTAGLNRLAPELRNEVLSNRKAISKTAIQQLARIPEPQELLRSWEEVTSLLNDEPSQPELARNDNPTREELFEELERWLGTLKSGKGNWKAACDGVIQCAQQLKTVGGKISPKATT